MHCWQKVFLIAALVLVQTGCKKNNLLFEATGHFQGNSLSRKATQVKQAQVTAEITLVSKNELHLSTAALDNPADTSQFIFRIESKKKAQFFFPGGDSAGISLKPSVKNCLTTENIPDHLSATICFNGIDLTIELDWGQSTNKAYTLSVSRVGITDLPKFEKPQTYTVAQLIDRAMKQSFDTAVQFERVVQAKLKTQTAYLNLIPHLSTNAVLNIASMNLIGYLKAAGDVVPFLFPTRWLETKEAKFQSEAEFDAMILSKADAANIVEGLAYGVSRDAAVVSLIEKNQKYISEIKEQIRQREQTGLMQAGASDDVASILNSIAQGSSALQNNLKLEKIALAEGAGFYNYAAIDDIVPVEGQSIAQIKPYDNDTINKISKIALDRSYERRQMGALLNVARLKKKERYFQWLDPSGDRDGGLGFNLIPYIKIGTSQIQELIDKEHKLEAGIIDKVAAAALAANQALEAYGLAQAGNEIQTRRITRHLGNMESGVNFSMSDLTNALQERLKTQIELTHAQYAYYTAQSNLNRALLSGPYALLPTDRGEASWVVSTGTSSSQ